LRRGPPRFFALLLSARLLIRPWATPLTTSAPFPNAYFVLIVTFFSSTSLPHFFFCSLIPAPRASMVSQKVTTQNFPHQAFRFSMSFMLLVFFQPQYFRPRFIRGARAPPSVLNIVGRWSCCQFVSPPSGYALIFSGRRSSTIPFFFSDRFSYFSLLLKDFFPLWVSQKSSLLLS